VVRNVRPRERVPRVAIAIALAAGASRAPRWLRLPLYGLAAEMLATVAMEYCPVNAMLGRGLEERKWTTLRTNRVEA
jgi:hypothetical protein